MQSHGVLLALGVVACVALAGTCVRGQFVFSETFSGDIDLFEQDISADVGDDKLTQKPYYAYVPSMNEVFFSGHTTGRGEEPWRVGLSAGTLPSTTCPGQRFHEDCNATAFPVRDILLGIFSSDPHAFFLLRDDALWRNDGNTSANGAPVAPVVMFGDYSNFSTAALWRSDGTTQGTRLISQLEEDDRDRRETFVIDWRGGSVAYESSSGAHGPQGQNVTRKFQFGCFRLLSFLNNDPGNYAVPGATAQQILDDLWCTDGTSEGTFKLTYERRALPETIFAWSTGENIPESLHDNVDPVVLAPNRYAIVADEHWDPGLDPDLVPGGLAEGALGRIRRPRVFFEAADDEIVPEPTTVPERGKSVWFAELGVHAENDTLYLVRRVRVDTEALLGGAPIPYASPIGWSPREFLFTRRGAACKRNAKNGLVGVGCLFVAHFAPDGTRQGFVYWPRDDTDFGVAAAERITTECNGPRWLSDAPGGQLAVVCAAGAASDVPMATIRIDASPILPASPWVERRVWGTDDTAPPFPGFTTNVTQLQAVYADLLTPYGNGGVVTGLEGPLLLLGVGSTAQGNQGIELLQSRFENECATGVGMDPTLFMYPTVDLVPGPAPSLPYGMVARPTTHDTYEIWLWASQSAEDPAARMLYVLETQLTSTGIPLSFSAGCTGPLRRRVWTATSVDTLLAAQGRQPLSPRPPSANGGFGPDILAPPFSASVFTLLATDDLRTGSDQWVLRGVHNAEGILDTDDGDDGVLERRGEPLCQSLVFSETGQVCEEYQATPRCCGCGFEGSEFVCLCEELHSLCLGGGTLGDPCAPLGLLASSGYCVGSCGGLTEPGIDRVFTHWQWRANTCGAGPVPGALPLAGTPACPAVPFITVEQRDCGFNETRDCLGTPAGESSLDACRNCFLPWDVERDPSPICIDCNGTINGTDVLDECGNCVRPEEADLECIDCFGTPFGTARRNPCGDCETQAELATNNGSCRDCRGIFFNASTLAANNCTGEATFNKPGCPEVADICGICGGDNSTCRRCDGSFFGNAFIDQCGVCVSFTNGKEPNAERDSCGLCPTWLNPLTGRRQPDPLYDKAEDACGVCFGDNSTCAGCDGVPNSGATIGNCGACIGGTTGQTNASVLDACGFCPGEGPFVDACGTCNGTQLYYCSNIAAPGPFFLPRWHLFRTREEAETAIADADALGNWTPDSTDLYRNPLQTFVGTERVYGVVLLGIDPQNVSEAEAIQRSFTIEPTQLFSCIIHPDASADPAACGRPPGLRNTSDTDLAYTIWDERLATWFFRTQFAARVELAGVHAQGDNVTALSEASVVSAAIISWNLSPLSRTLTPFPQPQLNEVVTGVGFLANQTNATIVFGRPHQLVENGTSATGRLAVTCTAEFGDSRDDFSPLELKCVNFSEKLPIGDIVVLVLLGLAALLTAAATFYCAGRLRLDGETVGANKLVMPDDDLVSALGDAPPPPPAPAPVPPLPTGPEPSAPPPDAIPTGAQPMIIYPTNAIPPAAGPPDAPAHVGSIGAPAHAQAHAYAQETPGATSGVPEALHGPGAQQPPESVRVFSALEPRSSARVVAEYMHYAVARVHARLFPQYRQHRD